MSSERYYKHGVTVQQTMVITHPTIVISGMVWQYNEAKKKWMDQWPSQAMYKGRW